MKSNKKLYFFIGLAVLVCIISYFAYDSMQVEPKEISYNTFLENVEEGKIDIVYLTDNDKIKGLFKDGKKFVTDNPRNDELKEKLLMLDITVDELQTNTAMQNFLGSAFFVVIVIGAIIYMSRQTSRQTSNGMLKLSSMNTEPEDESSIKFNDVAGNEEAKESVMELMDFIKQPDKYTKYGARLPRGVILYGPPGTGKTLMAKALAGEAGVPFYAVSGSDFVQVYVGVGAGRIRSLFKKARQTGKCVIFIDEIDALGKRRGSRSDGASDEKDQTLNALLTELSGFKDNDGVVVIAATNRLDTLDDALLRPGRFDRHIEIRLPDVNERYEILKLHVKNKPIASNIDLMQVAKQTVYFSGAKLENMLNEAAIIAAQKNNEAIDMMDIDKAFYTVIAGSEKKDRTVISEADRKITAYHEAGHALITKLISSENTVSKITIIPSTKGVGGFSMNIPPDRMYHRKSEMENNIKICLAGRASEEIIFGEDNITTGASSDIQKATEIMTDIIKKFGMNKRAGIINYDVLHGNSYISSTGEELIEECRNMMESMYDEVKELLTNNIFLLEKISLTLLEKESLNEKELNDIMRQDKVSA